MSKEHGAIEGGTDEGVPLSVAAASAEVERILGSVRAAATEAEGNRQAAAKSAADAELDRAAAREHLSEIASAKEKLTAIAETAAQNAANAAEHSKHVEDGRIYIDGQRSNAEAAANSASAQLNEISAVASAAQSSLAAIEAVKSSAGSSQTQIESFALEVRELLGEAKSDREATKKLADVADSVTSRVAGYESKLEEFKRQFDDVYKKIESLLPAATSAGLANAFHEQRSHYKWPRRLWNATFFAAILALIVFGALEFYHGMSTSAPDYNETLRRLFARLPLVAALVWLALHAAHKVRIADQILEEYAFKEVISRAFEGYKKEFESLAANSGTETAVAKLCSAMIAIISSPPGLVYDRRGRDPTPMSSAAEIAKAIEIAKKLPSIK